MSTAGLSIDAQRLSLMLNELRLRTPGIKGATDRPVAPD
jgi:hypothetical protein